VNMNVMLWIGPAAFGVGVGAVTMALVSRSHERRTSSVALQSIVGAGIDIRQAELAAPLSQRLLGPVGQSLTKVARAVTPGTMVARLRQNTSLAGLGSLGVEGALALKTAGAALMALIFPLGLALIGVGVGNVVILGLIGAAIGFVLPDVFIAQRGRKRQAEIRKALPETLDLLAIAVGAGMGLEAAIELVIQRLPGALGQEFYRILQELSLGVARREAFGSLRTRTEVDELSTFALILTQADALGTPLSVVLKSQAAEMRMLRRQRAREQGAKTPVALLFPLLLGIFPALMLVVIGPAIISIMKAFSAGHA
jgi:tight adherence protein C